MTPILLLLNIFLTKSMSNKESWKDKLKKLKNLNALNDLNASLTTNYENLLCKFKFLSEKHEELKLKIESINDANNFLETKQSTPSTSSNSKVDASTSCLDLINESNPCNEKCFENVIVESCDDLIANLVWSGVDDLVRGTWRPPSFVEKLLSGNWDQGYRGDSVSPGETWLPRSNTLSECFKNVDAGVPLC